MEDTKIQNQAVEETATESPKEEVKDSIVEEKKEQEAPKEEMISMTKKDFDARIFNAKKEGERNAQKVVNQDNEQLKASNKALQDQVNALNQTIKMDSLGIAKEKQASLITLILADQKEPTNEVIEEYASKYSEWKKQDVQKGIEEFGQVVQQEEIDPLKELNDYRISKGLKPIKK